MDDKNKTPAKPEVEKVTDVSVFFTRGPANEGIILPLFTREGRETDKWLRVRGIDSDAFRAREVESLRALAPIAEIKDEAKRSEAIAEEKIRTIASLIMGWNLDLEFTPDNVLMFLREAPQIAEQVDRIAGRRALFFKQRPWNSSPGPDGSTGSSESRPDAPNP